MAMETLYIVQCFVAGRGSDLRAEPQLGCKSAQEALRRSERLAPLRLGVVAYEVSADTETGDYEEPIILFRSGQLPPPFAEDDD